MCVEDLFVFNFFFINISLDFFVFFALVQAQGYNDKKSIEQ